MLRAAAFATAVALVTTTAHAGVFFDFQLTGGQEVPPNDSDSFGFATLEYMSDTQTFDLFVVTDGIAFDDLLGVGPNNTPIHIHNAAAGSNGPIVVDLGLEGSFVDEGDGVLTFTAFDVSINGFEDALFSAELYLNIHTSNFPAGEIRGQIVPAPGAAALVGLAGLAATRRRR